MPTVLKLTPLGQPAGEPITLDRRRRRLSTVMKQNHRNRCCLVYRVPQGQTFDPERHVVRLSRWRHTLVGKHDTIVVLPLVGKTGGGQQSGLAKAGMIALTVAAIALTIFSAGLSTALAGAIGVSLATAKVIVGLGTAALLIGGSAAINAMTRQKANNPTQLYGITGGGNLPKLHDRRQVMYGYHFVEPDLCQQDYSFYDGNDVVLVKRLAITEGKFAPDMIRVGRRDFWTADGNTSDQAPTGTITGAFDSPSLAANVRPAIEWIYGTASTLMPGTIYSSPSVAGGQMPGGNDTPSRDGPYPVCNSGQKVKKIQVDYSFPNGAYTRNGAKENRPVTVNVIFRYREIDDDGAPVGDGSWTTLHQESGAINQTTPIRRTKIIDVPEGRYEVDGANPAWSSVPNNPNINGTTWDGLRGLFGDTVVRPNRTELVIRLRSRPGQIVSDYSQITVRGTRILPVYDSGTSTWADQGTRQARWACTDILRNADYGAGLADSRLDMASFSAYTLSEDDTFDGVIRGPVSVWEACGTVMQPTRGDVVKIGGIFALRRDEPASVTRHVISRRNIVKGSSVINFDFGSDQGAGDFIGTFLWGGDPLKQDTIRSTMPGYESRTPTRVELTGITDGYHARRHLDWLAASTAYRTMTRDLTTEWDGRNYVLGDSALVDNWFFDPKVSAQIDSYTAGTRTLEMDGDIDVSTYPYCTIRDRKGKAFGPISITAGPTPYEVVLDADDLTAAQTAAGLTIDQVLNADNQEKTIVVFGGLVELQEAYKVRGIRWDTRERIKVSLTYDDPRVWAAIGADMPTYTPPSAVNDDIPAYNSVSVSSEVQDTGVIVKWTLRPVLPGQVNEVALTYDGQITWATISTSPDTTGQAPVNYNGPDLVYLRARGLSVDGTPGQWSTPVGFTVPAPRLDGIYLEPGSVLFAAQEAAAQIVALRSQLEDIAESYRKLAIVASNDQVVTANDIRKVRVERESGDVRVTAQFVEAISAVATAMGGLADRTTALEVTVDTPTTGLLARVGGHDTALVDLSDGQSALADSLEEVEAKTDAGTASGSVRFTAMSAPVGVSALYEMQISSTGPSGTFVTAGEQYFVASDGTSYKRTNARVAEWGFYDDAGIWQPGLYYDAVNQRLTVQNLVVPGTAILPGAITRGFVQQLSTITVGSYQYPPATFPNVNMQNASTTILWTDWLSQTLTLDDKSADDAENYRVRLSCAADGIVKLSNQSPAGGWTALYFRILKGTTVIAGPIKIGESTNGSGAGGTVSGLAGHGETNFLDAVANTGGTNTYKMQLGLQSSGTQRFAGADLSTANFSAECIVK